MGMACQNCTLFQTQSINNQNIDIFMPLLMISGLFAETFGKTQWILLSGNKQSGNKDCSREGFLEGMVTPTEWSGNIVYICKWQWVGLFQIKKKEKNCLEAPHLAVF